MEGVTAPNRLSVSTEKPAWRNDDTSRQCFDDMCDPQPGATVSEDNSPSLTKTKKQTKSLQILETIIIMMHQFYVALFMGARVATGALRQHHVWELLTLRKEDEIIHKT